MKWMVSGKIFAAALFLFVCLFSLSVSSDLASTMFLASVASVAPGICTNDTGERGGA